MSAKYGKVYLRRHPITDYGESQKRDSNRECKSHPVHYFQVIDYGRNMSSGEINREALREIYPATSLGCFIRKPVSIDYLVKRIMSELH